MAKSTYVRTQVRTKNPAKGVYRTMDGSHEIRQAEKKGCWDVYRLVDDGAQRIAAEVCGSDRALDRILEEPGVTLEQLNTPARQAEARGQGGAGRVGAAQRRHRARPQGTDQGPPPRQPRRSQDRLTPTS